MNQASDLDSTPCRSAPSRGRQSRSSHRSCKACGTTRLPSGYNEKYRICKACYQAQQLLCEDQLMRFCQQCSKLQPLDEFDGDRRSCRHALERHASRRQSRQSRTARSPSPLPQLRQSRKSRTARSPSPLPQPRPACRPQPRPACRPRLEQPASQELPSTQQQQQHHHHQKQQALPASPVGPPAPSGDLEAEQLWPAELLKLAQQEQQDRQRREGQPQQLGDSLAPGSLSLVVGHRSERMEITISLEPWLQSQPAPCPEGSSAGEPVVSAREAWQESLASLPAVRASPFQQAAAIPSATRCSSQSAATMTADATTMLPLPVPTGGALALLGTAGSGSGCLSPTFAARGSGSATDLPVHMPFAASPTAHSMELTGSNSFRLSGLLLPGAPAAAGPPVQRAAVAPTKPSAPVQGMVPQQLAWSGQLSTLPSPRAAGQPPAALDPRGSSNWGNWL